MNAAQQSVSRGLRPRRKRTTLRRLLMRIACCVDSEGRRVLSRAVPRETVLEDSGNLALLRRQAEGMLVDVIVIDPNVVREEFFEAVLRIASAAPVPLLLLTVLTPFSARQIVRAIKRCATDFVIRGGESDVTILAHLIQHATVPRASPRLLRVLSDCLETLPAPIERAIVQCFSNDPPAGTVKSLTRELGIPRRSLDRVVAAAGLQSTARVITAARLSQTWEPLAVDRTSIQIVADTHGFGSVETMVKHYKRLVGLPPHTAVRRLSIAEFAERLAKSIL